MLGTAGLPHILIRFYTVPDSKTARRSVNWAIGLIGLFYLMTLVIGFGAAALLTQKEITDRNPAGNTAAPQLAEALGGQGTGLGAVMLSVIAAVAFATILAVVAGLTLASSSSLAHDFYANVIRKGKATDEEEVRVGRIAAVVIGAVSIALAIPAQSLNVAFLVGSRSPSRRRRTCRRSCCRCSGSGSTRRGATWGIYGGLGSALILLHLLPQRVRQAGQPGHREVAQPVQRPEPSTSTGSRWTTPGWSRSRSGFLFAIVGTVMSKEWNKAKWAEMEVRSLTGVAAEKAVKH